ncbi:MAG: ATP-binding protein [Candidatus Riflemargulisbacteria bacterium]
MEKQYLHIQIPCELKQVKGVRQLMNEFCKDINFSKEDVLNLEIALNEGLSNAIDHGSFANKKKFVDIEFNVEGRSFFIKIKDFGGKEFNPEFFERISLKKDWGHGGRGIYLMKSIMDELSYVFLPGQYTLLYMSKKIPKEN